MEETSRAPDEDSRSRRRSIAFLAISGVGVVFVLWSFREVLAPFALALLVAYVFAPLVDRMERLRVGERRLPRWLAVLVLYLSLLSALAASVGIGAPLLARELARLTAEAPRIVQRAREDWIPTIDRSLRTVSQAIAPSTPDEPPERTDETEARAESRTHIAIVPRADGSYEVTLPPAGIVVEPREDGTFVVRSGEPEAPVSTDLSVQIGDALRRQMQEGEHSATSALRAAQSVVAAVVNGIFKFFIMLMLSAYLLITSESIFRFFRSMVRASARASYDRLLRRIDQGMSGVVRGQLVICLVNGVLSGVGFWLADLPYWPLLTLVATVLSIIPIFGAILSSIPAVAVGLQSGIGTAVFVLAWIIGIHQVEANLLNPKIMGDAAKVHPVLVVFSLIAGEHFFGILGALFAVPVLSLTQSLFLHFREVAMGLPAGSSSGAGMSAAAISAAVGVAPGPADATRRDAPRE